MSDRFHFKLVGGPLDGAVGNVTGDLSQIDEIAFRSQDGSHDSIYLSDRTVRFGLFGGDDGISVDNCAIYRYSGETSAAQKSRELLSWSKAMQAEWDKERKTLARQLAKMTRKADLRQTCIDELRDQVDELQEKLAESESQPG